MANEMDRIDADIKASMLAKDNVKRDTLRMLKSALKYYLIEKKLETLSQTDLIAVVQKQVKQRNDSIEEYNKGGRPELAEKEQAEIKVLQSYLPQALPPEELEALIKGIIAEVGATTKAQIGLVMKAAIPKVAGRADSKSINQTALKFLS